MNEFNELEANPQAVPPDVIPDATSVEIYDQVYHLRGSDSGYIEMLAGMVDQKMRAVASTGGTVDSLRVAVLASLNLAFDLAAQQAAAIAAPAAAPAPATPEPGEVDARAAQLIQKLDQALAGDGHLL